MSAARRYLLFLAALAGITLALLAIGYLPTRSIGGEVALPAMLLGCAVSFVGSALGALPIATAGSGERAGVAGVEGLKRITAAMALRLLLVAALAGGVLWLLSPSRRPFLLWLAISYLVLLVADTGFARATLRRL